MLIILHPVVTISKIPEQAIENKESHPNQQYYKIGNITIDQHEILGIGSIGTIVFGGVFDGREVAIKRMLCQFNIAAEKEISSLMLSDTNPYVIRYFTKEVDR